MFNGKITTLTRKNINKFIHSGILEIPETVRYIQEGAARNCSKIKTVNIPDTVKEIGAYAFAESSVKKIIFASRSEYNKLVIKEYAFFKSELEIVNLENVILGEGVFASCEDLINITIGDGVTNIPERCFAGTSITSIQIPSSVVTIGAGAFCGCCYLCDIIISSDLQEIPKKLFCDCYRLKSFKISATNVIGEMAFYRCYDLEEVEIVYPPEWRLFTLEIQESAFRKCTSLRNLKVNNSIITHVGNSAFYECLSLKKIDLSKTSQIEESAFDGAKGLRSVGTILERIESIGDYAFRNCESLLDIVFGELLTKIGKSAFSGCKRIKTVELPASLIYLGESAFFECSDLVEVDILSKELEMLPNSIFEDCKSLEKVTVNPECEIVTIESNAFKGCLLLCELNISQSLYRIGKQAFYKCVSIRELLFGAKRLIIEDDAFSCCESLERLEIKGNIDCICSAFNECNSLQIIKIPFPNRFEADWLRVCRNLQKIEFQQREHIFVH